MNLQYDRIFLFPVVMFSTLLFSGPLEAVSDTIGVQKQSLTDTGFYQWLREYQPDRDDQKRRRWKLLLGHEAVSSSEKVEIYRQWSEFSGSLPRPTDQIGLALRSGSESLARSWLEQWWKQPPKSQQTVASMVDILVDGGQLEWARETLQYLEDRWKFYQRRGAIEEALGNPQGALTQYLRAWARSPYSRYLRVQVLTLVRNHNLSQQLIRKTRQLTNYAQRNLFMLEAVDQYFLEKGDYEGFIDWVEVVQPTQKRTVWKIRTVRDRLLNSDDVRGAKRLTEWLIQRPDLEVPPDIQILIDLRSQNLTRAAHRLHDIDTGLRSDPRFYSLRIELALRSRNFDRLRSLDPLQHPSWIPRELFQEYLKATHQYEQLASEIAKVDPPPISQLLIRFRQGKQIDTMVRSIAHQNQESKQLPLALALAGLSNPQPAREFLRLLDRYPLDIPVDTKPIERLLHVSFQPPSVLVDEWYSRFDCDSVSAETLRRLGRNLQYPPLLLESAKRFDQEDQSREAIRTLEELLIHHPHTPLRDQAEQLLFQLS